MAGLVKPSVEYDRRAAITESLRAERMPAKITKFFEYPRSTVHGRCEEIQNLGVWEINKDSRDHRPKSPRHDFGKPGDPRSRNWASWGWANRFGSRAHLRYIPLMSSRSAKCSPRPSSSKGMLAVSLRSLKHKTANRVRFFSDEKTVTVAKVNRRNDRGFVRNSEDVPAVGKPKFPANNQMLSVVWSKDDIIPPYFFQKGETVRKKGGLYLKVLSDSGSKLWMKTVTSQRSYIFQ